MRVVVTGGAGYIGSHSIRALRAAGHQVVVYDNLSTGHAEFCDGFELVTGDIADRSKMLQTLEGADATIHFAASAYVGESVQRPRQYYQNNVENTLVFLNACLDAGVKFVVFSSTCAVYGNPGSLPLTEAMLERPLSPYGLSKLFIEKVLESYSAAYGLRYAALRYFNAAGADASGAIGEDHRPETHLIPLLLRVAAGIDPEISIFGDEYPTHDGTCIRDYIHVTDLARAHVAALHYVSSDKSNIVANLGTGKGHSVREVVSIAESVADRAIAVRVRPPREGDPAVLYADATLARTRLAWSPEFTLEDMISSAWHWFQTRIAR